MLDIACCGTSLTWLYYFQPEVVRLLGGEVVAYNLGASGRNSGQGLVDIRRAVELRPRVALVEFSMNDCAALSLAAARGNTVAIINALKEVVEPDLIFLMTMNPTIGGTAGAATRMTLPAHYQQYRDLAASEQVGLIDIAPVWAAQLRQGDIPDGIHPTCAAQQRVTAPAIASALLGAV